MKKNQQIFPEISRISWEFHRNTRINVYAIFWKFDEIHKKILEKWVFSYRKHTAQKVVINTYENDTTFFYAQAEEQSWQLQVLAHASAQSLEAARWLESSRS